MPRSLVAAVAAVLAVSLAPAGASADLPHPDVDYIAGQLVTMSSNYLMRYSGFDGPPGDMSPQDGNLPPQVNGWQEFFQHWKDQMRDPQVLGSFAKAGAIADHPFPVSIFGFGDAPYPGDVPVLTIPGARCPGQNTLVASHPDSTEGLNTGNGSTYDDTSGVTMGMGETQAMARWWSKHDAWPARTFRLGLFDAEEVGLEGSYWYASHLIPPGPQGQYVLAANMDQNGLEYPAYPLGTDHSTFNPGPWYTNINASPVKDFSLGDYNDGHGHPNAAIAANMPAIEHFRAALAEEVRQAFIDQGAKYHHQVPLVSGTAAAYDPADIATKSPVQDDTLGRTDQVPFVARGIPGFGVLGAFDSTPSENPAAGLGPLAPLGDGSLISIPQQAGYDTPRDNVAHFNAMTGGVPDPTAIGQAGKQALELPATWTSYLLARSEYSGSVARPKKPIAFFDALPVAPKPGDEVDFDARPSVDVVGKGLTYRWSFGDGTSGTGVTPKHTYAQAGWYDAILVVTDKAGHSVGYRQAVKVGSPTAAAPKTDPCGSVGQSDVERVARGR